MDFSHNTAQLLDASFAYGAVVVFQCIYCGLKFLGILHVPDRYRLWIVTGLACGFGLTGLVFTLVRTLAPTTALVTMNGWKSSSVLSICITEVIQLPTYSDSVLHACRFLRFCIP